MKRIKKVVTLLLCLLLFNSMIFIQKATAQSKPLDNIIDEIILITETNGQIKDYESCKLQIKWSIKSEHKENIKLGDYVEIELPKELHFENNSKIGLKDESSGGIKVGDISAEEYLVKLTFSNIEYINSKSKVSGNIYCDIKYKDTNNTESYIKKDLEFKVNGAYFSKSEVNHIPNMSEKRAILKKGGMFIRDNNNQIEWTIRINAKNESFSDLVIEDTVDEFQKLKTDRFKLRKVKFEKDGTYTVLSTCANINLDFIDDRNFRLSLGETNDSYVLKYTTEIIDNDQNEYSNIVDILEGTSKVTSSKSTIERKTYIDGDIESVNPPQDNESGDKEETGDSDENEKDDDVLETPKEDEKEQLPSSGGSGSASNENKNEDDNNNSDESDNLGNSENESSSEDIENTEDFELEQEYKDYFSDFENYENIEGFSEFESVDEEYLVDNNYAESENSRIYLKASENNTIEKGIAKDPIIAEGKGFGFTCEPWEKRFLMFPGTYDIEENEITHSGQASDKYINDEEKEDYAFSDTQMKRLAQNSLFIALTTICTKLSFKGRKKKHIK